MSDDWDEVGPIGYEEFATPIKLNDHQFAIIPSRSSKNAEDDEGYADGIYAYDIRYNDTHKIIDYPKGLATEYPSAVYHKQKNTIYILNAQKHLLKFDLTAQKSECLQQGIKGISNYPKIILIGDEIHIFGSTSSVYAIYDCNEDVLAYQPSPDENHQFHKYPFMYSKSENTVLFFNCESKQIIMYSFINRAWSMKNVIMKQPSVPIAATSDDKYIICRYEGHRGSAFHDYSITIYDVDNNKFVDNRLDIPCEDPDGTGYCKTKGIIMDDGRTSDLLAFGFVRESAEQMFTPNVMTLIWNFVTCYDLYVIDYYENKHYRIDVADFFT